MVILYLRSEKSEKFILNFKTSTKLPIQKKEERKVNHCQVFQTAQIASY